MAIVSDQSKAVILGNAIGNLRNNDSRLRTDFHVLSTVISVKLNTKQYLRYINTMHQINTKIRSNESNAKLLGC